MSELAFNINGEPFEVPSSATGWRVRRMKSKGAPEVVYGRNGVPLILPLEADLDDVRSETGLPGRYRLDPVDEGNRPIPSASAGYVYVHDQSQALASSKTTSLPPASDSVVIEAMRMNAEMARSIIDRFPQMLEAAAVLLRAADGAGLPSRSSAQIDSSDDDDDDDEVTAQAPAGFDLNAIVAQVLPMLLTSLGSGKIKLPSAASVIDWRKAAPKEIDTKATSVEVAEVTEALPPIDAKTMTHFISIQSVLDPDEAALAREVAGNLPPAELRAWFDELSGLTVAEAVKKIRVLLKGAKS
jgi:hypothetical protein